MILLLQKMVILVVVLVLSTLNIISAEADKLCHRVLFRLPSEDSFPYFVVEGVYKRTSTVVDNFPVFVHEQGGVYFQYSKAAGKLYFARSLGTREYLGLSATAYKTAVAGNWMRIAPRFPFNQLISNWMTYDPIRQTNVYWSNSRGIDAFCVDDFIFKCTSGKIFFNSSFVDGSKILSDMKTDYFSQLYNTYRSNRPVFQHSKKKDWFLFYADGHWIVGPNFLRAYGSIKVKTTARRPEYVTENWQFYNSGRGRWEPFGSPVGLRCKGHKPGVGEAECGGTKTPCPLGTECYQNILNETVCKCNPGHTGPLCSKREYQCPKYQLNSVYESLAVQARRKGYEGDPISVFCSKYMSPTFTVGICSRNRAGSSYWKKQNTCKRKYTPTTVATFPTRSRIRRRYRPIKNSKGFNADDYNWIRPTVLAVSICLQILIPCFFFCCDVSFWRMTSLFLFISMLMWTLYLIGCVGTKCGRYGKIFGDLVVMAFVMLVIGYVFNVVESLFSAEREYVSMVIEDRSLREYLDLMKRRDVTITGTIECYHMETRTRTVYYTDSNGNSQTRIETYQEMVVTYTESQVFVHGYFRDISPVDLPPLSVEQVTRLKITKEIICGDDETTQALHHFKDDLIERNRHRDVSIVYHQDEAIEGYREHVCAYLDKVDRPFWMNSCGFWLATIFCMTWPYRWFFKLRTGKSYYTLRKEIFVSEPPPAVLGGLTTPSFGSNVQPYPVVNQPVQNGGQVPTGVYNSAETSFVNPTAPPPDYNTVVNQNPPLNYNSHLLSRSADNLIHGPPPEYRP